VTDATRRFDPLADDYARFRPGYPRALVDALRAARGLPPGAHVADVGCGTGLLAVPFLDDGYRVTGVEPSPVMRAHAQAALGARPGFRLLDGLAEATGLPGASLDAVVAGQAAHWFDRAAARAEFARVLRPGGWVAAVWNNRKGSREPLLVEYEALLHEHCPAYGADLREATGEALAAELLGAGRYGVLHVPNPQSLDWDGLAGRTRSASYVPREEPGRSALFAALRALFERHQRGGRVAFTLDTLAYHAPLPA
jgi:SAM-dependent methyltransferase